MRWTPLTSVLLVTWIFRPWNEEGVLTDVTVSAPQLQSQTHTVAWKLFTGQGWFAVSMLELNPNPVSQRCDLRSHISTHWGYMNCSSLLKRLWKKGTKTIFSHPLPVKAKAQYSCTFNSYPGNRLLKIWLWTSQRFLGKEHVEAL